MDQNGKNRVVVFVLLALIPLAAIGIYVEERFIEPGISPQQAAVQPVAVKPAAVRTPTAALPEISERTAFEMCAAVLLAAGAYPADVRGGRDGNQWRFNWTAESPIRTEGALGVVGEPGSCVAQDDGQVSSVRVGGRVIR